MTPTAFRQWLASLAEAEATVPARIVLERLPDDPEVPAVAPGPELDPEPTSWREKLWTVPAETRLGVHELAEALDRSRTWIYHRTGPSADDPLPCRKLDGTLIFTAGEVRAWLRGREEVVHAGPMESPGLGVVR